MTGLSPSDAIEHGQFQESEGAGDMKKTVVIGGILAALILLFVRQYREAARLEDEKELLAMAIDDGYDAGTEED